MRKKIPTDKNKTRDKNMSPNQHFSGGGGENGTNGLSDKRGKNENKKQPVQNNGLINFNKARTEGIKTNTNKK